jgi:type IV pilus assembly protein PilN
MALYQNPIRINLMPHREALKETRKKAFFMHLLLTTLLAAALMLLAWQFINTKITAQKARNSYISDKTKILDEEIKQIATLQAEIDALKARQKAVEDLQSDRNLPVYVFQELTSFVPEGVYLKAIKQDAKRVVITGLAQTQEKISEMLRNFTNASIWLEKPTLIESKLAAPGVLNAKGTDKLYEFTLAVMAKRDQKTPVGTNGAVVAQAAVNSSVVNGSSMAGIAAASTVPSSAATTLTKKP